MGMLPAPAPPGQRLLVLGTSEVESVVVTAALLRATSRPVSTVFTAPADLGLLAELPAFRQGRTRTVLLGFPALEVTARPADVLRALRSASDLVWVTQHPVTLPEGEGLTGVRVVSAKGPLWPATAEALDLAVDEMDRLEGLLAELPEALPEVTEADFDLSWRYALEAARQDLPALGVVARRLADLEEPELDVVGQGRELVRERRDIAATSGFHVFPIASGRGVMVPVPRSALGYYLDLARDARQVRDCDLCVLAFDSQEPAVIEYAQRPLDLDARMDLLRSSLPDHRICGHGRAGIAIIGLATGSLELLETLIGELAKGIH